MKFKRLIALLCSAAMMCTCTAFADTETADDAAVTSEDIELMALGFDGGDGTEGNPYLISNEQQLAFVGDLPDKCYKLTTDITLQNEWTPIGAYGEAFSGTFDGDGHTVSNMNVSDGEGFFKATTGTVKNLNVTGSVTSSSEYAGGIAGKASGVFENCSFSGDVAGGSNIQYIGGLVGYYQSSTMNNCHTDGNITSANGGYVGGLIGWASSYNSNYIASNCHSTCNITGGTESGGLIGGLHGAISNCYATGKISGAVYVGGLIGCCELKDGRYVEGCIVKRCYATGDVIPLGNSSKYAYGGGLIGVLHETAVDGVYENVRISESFALGSVKSNKIDDTTILFDYSGGLYGGYFGYFDTYINNCFALGNVYGNISGGLCGVNHYDLVINNSYSTGSAKKGFIGDGSASTTSCYYDSQTSGCNDTNTGLPRTTAGMKNQLIYDGWDFEDVWGIDETESVNDGYPYLKWAVAKLPQVTGISLDRTDAEMRINTTVTLNAILEGENVENAVVKWTSNNDGVASVSGGVVTAKTVGTAVITASCGGYSASSTVNVTDGTIRVTGVTLDKASAGLVVGETTQLTATVMPEGATNKEIKWTSSSNAVATVSDSGLVTALTEGTAQIRATSVSNGSCYAICDVTVAAKRVPVTGIEISNNMFGLPIEVDIGKTALISYSVKPDNATNKSVIWTSGDSNIATVENGRVTGVSEGSTTITATTADGGYSASCRVTVTKPTVAVTGIQVYPEQMTVNVKEQKKLQAAVTPSDATDTNITFKSNNNAIANVTADGTVTGVSSSLEIVEGKTVPLKAVIKPSNATYKLLTWSTSEESIATVSQDGYVTAQGEGDAVISVTATNGVHTECSVKVLPSDTPAQLRVENATVKAGKEIPITVSIASNPGISTFHFDLTYDNTKMYPVSYTAGDVLSNVNIVTPLGSQSFEDKTSVRFLCNTKDLKNMDTDGDLITVVFKTLENVEYGDYTIGIVPSGFTNEFYDAVNLVSNNCTLSITDYTIGDVNNDDVVDLKDSMILGQYIAGFGTVLTPQGKKAAVSIYPDKDDDVNTSEPSLNDFQHLIRYLSDWQVELGKN